VAWSGSFNSYQACQTEHKWELSDVRFFINVGRGRRPSVWPTIQSVRISGLIIHRRP
jgi:hypothetical protein